MMHHQTDEGSVPEADRGSATVAQGVGKASRPKAEPVRLRKNQGVPQTVAVSADAAFSH